MEPIEPTEGEDLQEGWSLGRRAAFLWDWKSTLWELGEEKWSFKPRKSQSGAFLWFFLGKTIAGLRILQRVFESVIPMFVNHNLTYGQAVSPSFHASFAQKHVNTFSLLVLRASYQHHQKHSNTRTSALCCWRTAKWANPEGCSVKRRFHLLDLLGCSLNPCSVKIKGFASQNRNRSIVPTNVLGKGHPSPVQNCMISFENKSHECWWEPISSRIWRVFQLKKFTTFNRCTVGQGHGWRERLNAKKPRWTAPAEARRPRIQRKLGEYLISPKRCWIFGAFFSGFQEEMATVWWSKMVDHENHFGKPLQTAKPLRMLSLRWDLETQVSTHSSPDMDGLLMIYIIT